jgi:hypothetical protein
VGEKKRRVPYRLVARFAAFFLPFFFVFFAICKLLALFERRSFALHSAARCRAHG